MKVMILGLVSSQHHECGTWLHHWEKHSDQRLPLFCSAEGCPAAPTVGAIVQRDSAADERRYVVPLCTAHSGMSEDSIDLDFEARLVPADVE